MAVKTPKINLPSTPGITALLNGYPKTGYILRELAEVLLRTPSGLPLWHREVIAASVSRRNNCPFCYRSHKAAAMAYAGAPSGRDKVERYCDTDDFSSVGEFGTLLVLSEVVRKGMIPSQKAMDAAKDAGYNDEEIHNCVLITAAFCCFNRYVLGLNPVEATDEQYKAMGERLTSVGYMGEAKKP